MTIRHLKIFIAVVEMGKMRLAAEKLYISQPAISQAIQELENYYNVKLFERLGQKLYLIESGKKLLAHARHLVDSFEHLDLMMKNEGACPKIRIGASVSVGTYLLNDILDQVEEAIPDAEFQVIVHNTSKIEEMIKNSELDLGIVEGVVSNNDLVIEPIGRDELVIIVGKRHPLFKAESISFKELGEQTWIGREAGSSNRNQYEQLLMKGYPDLEHKWRCTNTETIKQTVINGRGLAIISNMLIQKEIKEGTLRILPVKDVKVERDIKLIYHKNKFISSALEAVVQICKGTSQK
nr:LysR family transcriptional regulator [uncultured Cellulosilyticum sp.]